MAKKRTHPKFLRPNYGRSSRSRIKIAWRRQRGIDNKKRMKIRYMGASPSIGYGQPSKIRHFHPSGMPEVLVQSPSEVAGLKGVMVRIASGVGRLKREAIIRLAEAAKLRVANKAKKYPPRPEKKEKKDEKKKTAEPAKKEEEGKKSEPAKEEAKAETNKPAEAAKKENTPALPAAAQPAPAEQKKA